MTEATLDDFREAAGWALFFVAVALVTAAAGCALGANLGEKPDERRVVA